MISYRNLAELTESLEKLLDVRTLVTSDDTAVELADVLIHRLLAHYADLAAKE